MKLSAATRFKYLENVMEREEVSSIFLLMFLYLAFKGRSREHSSVQADWVQKFGQGFEIFPSLGKRSEYHRRIVCRLGTWDFHPLGSYLSDRKTKLWSVSRHSVLVQCQSRTDINITCWLIVLKYKSSCATLWSFILFNEALSVSFLVQNFTLVLFGQ